MPPTDNIRIAAMENFTDAEGLGKFNLTDQEFLMSKNFRNTVEFQEDNQTTISGRTIYSKYIYLGNIKMKGIINYPIKLLYVGTYDFWSTTFEWSIIKIFTVIWSTITILSSPLLINIAIFNSNKHYKYVSIEKNIPVDFCQIIIYIYLHGMSITYIIVDYFDYSCNYLLHTSKHVM